MRGRILKLAYDSESLRCKDSCLTHHSSRLEGMSKSAAIVGKPTTTRPDRNALITVTHTTVTNTIVVVPFAGARIASKRMVFIGWASSTSGVSSWPLTSNFEGCEIVGVAKVSNSTSVAVRDIFADIWTSPV